MMFRCYTVLSDLFDCQSRERRICDVFSELVGFYSSFIKLNSSNQEEKYDEVKGRKEHMQLRVYGDMALYMVHLLSSFPLSSLNLF